MFALAWCSQYSAPHSTRPNWQKTAVAGKTNLNGQGWSIATWNPQVKQKAPIGRSSLLIPRIGAKLRQTGPSSTIDGREEGSSVTEATTPPQSADSTTSPLDPLVERQSEVSREMLREGIRRLQPTEREALRLATRDQLPVSRIAAQLNLPASDIETALQSGLTALRASLLEQLEGEGS